VAISDLLPTTKKNVVSFIILTDYTPLLTLFLAASLRGWVLEAFLVLTKENAEKICFQYRYFFFRRAVRFMRDFL
jgi:hypothetical protein